MTCFAALRTAVACAITCTTLGAAQAAPVAYDFTPLAEARQISRPPELTVPALSVDGRVAFGGTPRGSSDTVLLRSRTDGARPNLIAREGERFSRFGDVSISSNGRVAFEGSFEQLRGEGIFRNDRNGAGPIQIAGTRDAGDFDFVNAGPSVNRQGMVAFIGERIVGGDFIDGVWVGNGGPVHSAYNNRGAFSDFTGNPAINDLGQVAFLADLKNGVGGLFVGSGNGVFTVVADDRGPFTGPLGFSDPSLNDRGDVAFSAGTNPDFGDNGSSTGSGVFVWSGGVLRTVLHGRFSEYFSFGEPALNNLGNVAFTVERTFGDQILVTGPDLVNDRVVGVGDTLAGKTVSGIVLGREGYNDAGQLAFIAYYTDGSGQPFLATPRPPAAASR